MNLLIPLGLLGLLGLLVLLLIYILKPNYQQKLISSTYVWKLSLKYKKKRLPISKLRNLLILLCQIIIIVCAALIMAQPAIKTDTTVYETEKIAIIDASASMNSSYDGQSRLERAIEKVKVLTDDVLSEGGYITVILAGRNAEYISQRATSEEYDGLIDSLESLTCCYGEGDIQGALTLAEEALQFNSDAEVLLYTGTDYENQPENVTVEKCYVEGEWNVGILDATAELVDGFFVFTVDVACYGGDDAFEMQATVENFNGRDAKIDLPVATVHCIDEEVRKVVYSVDASAYGSDVDFVALSDNNKISSFESVYFRIASYELDRNGHHDSLDSDNSFYVLGGYRPSVKVQYCSDAPCKFINGSLSMIIEMLYANWDIEVDEIGSGKNYETSGYDVYIFENRTPTKLPSDGIVFFINPSSTVNDIGAGFKLGKRVPIQNWTEDGAELAAGADHPILDYVNVSELRTTEYVPIVEDSLDDYKALMYYQGNPVFIVKDSPNAKIAALSLDIHKSTLNLDFNFAILMYNFFEYFLPSTFDSHVYNVYDTVDLRGRADEVVLTDRLNNEIKFSELPAQYQVDAPGIYSVKQKLLSGTELHEQFYVRIDASQSNIKKTDILSGIQIDRTTGISYNDLLIYIASVIVALLFLEYFLQARGGI